MSDHSRSNILVVEDRLQLEKILSIREKLPHLRQIIQYSGDLSGESGVMSWSQLMELGRSQTDQLLDERLSKISVNQCAGLCYTSGTTGNPKVLYSTTWDVKLLSKFRAKKIHSYRICKFTFINS